MAVPNGTPWVEDDEDLDFDPEQVADQVAFNDHIQDAGPDEDEEEALQQMDMT